MFEMPSTSDWNRIEGSYNFDALYPRDDDFDFSIHGEDTIERFAATVPITSWKSHLANRLYQTRMSWVLLMYYFEKGIPDDEWMISPGRKGESIEYFPHFEKDDHLNKARFNYFEDTFYYKLFSAWDTLGHILNLIYGLEIDRVDFHKAVQKLKTLKPDLYNDLQAIIDSDDFAKMKRLRHDTTHNELPSGVSSMVTKSAPNQWDFGGGTYTPSKEIVDNAPKALDKVAEAMDAIRKQIAADS